MGKPEIKSHTNTSTSNSSLSTSSIPNKNTSNGKTKTQPSSKKTKRSKHLNSFSSYIKKMIIRTGPETTTSNDAVNVLSRFLDELRTDLSVNACRFADIARRQTIQMTDVRSAIKQMFPGKLGFDALKYADESVKNYKDSIEQDNTSSE